MVFHVDDIKIASTEEVTEVVASPLNQIFSTKHLGEVEWYIGSEYKRDKEKSYFRYFSDPVHPECTKSFGVSSPIPVPPSINLRHKSEEETGVDVPFCEIVGNLMCIANAVRSIARFSHDPKPINYKAA